MGGKFQPYLHLGTKYRKAACSESCPAWDEALWAPAAGWAGIPVPPRWRQSQKLQLIFPKWYKPGIAGPLPGGKVGTNPTKAASAQQCLGPGTPLASPNTDVPRNLPSYRQFLKWALVKLQLLGGLWQVQQCCWRSSWLLHLIKDSAESSA